MLQFIANHIGYCIVGFYVFCALIIVYAMKYWSKVVDPDLEDY